MSGVSLPARKRFAVRRCVFPREMFVQCTFYRAGNRASKIKEVRPREPEEAEGGLANICLRGEKTANPANYSRGSRREETARTLFLREPPARISSDHSSSLPSSDRDTKRSVTLPYYPIKILRVVGARLHEPDTLLREKFPPSQVAARIYGSPSTDAEQRFSSKR